MPKEPEFGEEAAKLRAAFDAKKRDSGITQESLGNELGVTQGLVGRWLSGHRRVPDKTLLTLSTILGFDVVEVRPGILDYVRQANRILGDNRSSIEALLSEVSESEEAQIEDYIRFLIASRRS